MKKQKVLLVHNKYRISGGEDIVVVNEKLLLEKNGHEVVEYIKDNNNLKLNNIFDKLKLAASTIFNVNSYKEVKDILLNQKVDVVHVHNTLPIISPSIYYAAKNAGIPVVQTIHNFRFVCPGATLFRNGMICEDCINHGLKCALRNKCYRNSFVETAISVLNTWIHRNTGILNQINYICLTDFNKKKLLEINKKSSKTIINPDSVFVKPNFVFQHPKSNPKDRLILSNSEIKPDLVIGDKYFNNEPFYLVVGRLEAIKGTQLIIDAFEQMPDKNVVFIGPGFEKFQKETIERNLDNIYFAGFIENKNLIPWYQNAKALILASQTYEGFPMSILESYKNELPVITVDFGNCQNLVIDRKTGLHFKSNSASSLKKAVEDFEKIPIADWNKNIQIEAEKYSETQNYILLKKIYDQICKQSK